MSLSQFAALRKMKPEVLRTMYATADVSKRMAFMTVLNMVGEFQNATAEGDDASTTKKRKRLLDLKVLNVSKSIMAAIVQHCDSVGAGLFVVFPRVCLV